MSTSLNDQITSILINAGISRTIGNANVKVEQVADACYMHIVSSVAAMKNFETTEMYQSVVRHVQNASNGTPPPLQVLNRICMAAMNALRNNGTFSTYSQFQTHIEKRYEKITQEYTDYSIADDSDLSILYTKPETVNQTKSSINVPDIDITFQKWGDYEILEKVINTKSFMPVMIVGLSGNGKSVQIEQACANLDRAYYRLQITPETDEIDMIGGMTLKDGNTVFEYGPVIKAMKEGAILCIDEIDRGSNRLMALQGVMEGKPVLIKKTGEVVKPAEGFNVIATANTKGQGDETGKFSAAGILDEAFLERFVMVIEQNFAPPEVERSILAAHMIKFGAKPSRSVINELIRWAEKTRTNFEKAANDEYISTRRLCHIIQIYSVVGDITEAVTRGVSRYDKSTKESLIEAFRLI